MPGYPMIVGDGYSNLVGYDIEGDDLDGEDVEGSVLGDVLGARRRRKARGGGGLVRLPAKPAWRQGQVAPGVMAPGIGRKFLGLEPSAGGGTFTAAIPSIIWSTMTQKPYRTERVLVSVVRTGASALGRLMALVYVGTDLQQASVQAIDIEQVGQPTSFDTGVEFTQAEPGVVIKVMVTLSNALAGSDTIFAAMQLVGQQIG